MSGATAMTLRQLLDDPDAPAIALRGIAGDSRQVRPGDVFVARKGAAYDGHHYAAAAVAAGAVAVISERPVDVAAPNVVLANAGERLGALARRFYGAPSRRIAVVGVTGTNGKSTVAHHIARLCDAGGYIGTLGWGVPPKLCRSTLTTADPAALQSQLRALGERGVRVVGLETSSHALAQGRVEAVDFAGAVFTNLSRDHLDYHGSMDAYARAKRRLFERPLKFAVANVDDAHGARIAKGVPAGVPVITVGRDADVRWRELRFERGGIRGRWHTPWGSAAFTLGGYFGDFSVSNAALAVAAAGALGADLPRISARLAQLPPVPGRMQAVGAAPTVLVDYAHTPDALRAVLAAGRAHLAAGGRLILVFGCGGDRDRGKRPLMAAAAQAGADVVVATSDNPRSENPARILEDMAAGFRPAAQVLRIADRRAAIAAAIAAARPQDIVILAGKGHETHQEVAGGKLPFDDAAVAREILAGRRDSPRKAAGGKRPIDSAAGEPLDENRGG